MDSAEVIPEELERHGRRVFFDLAGEGGARLGADAN
jgi:hypothetical protein